jgi:hypothetical protein
MSNLTLDRPAVQRTTSLRHAPVPAAVGSYVDTDGVRRAPGVRGSYTGTTTAVGAYAGSSRVVGSYVRSSR